MKPINGKILVTFEYDHSQTTVKTDSGFFIPERYVIEEGDEDADTAWGVTTDRKLINPKVINILSGVHAGKRAFVHYGAFEIAKWVSADRVKDGRAVIPEKMILFFIDPIACVPGTYLGEEVFGDLPKTASGIYLTAQLEEKEGVKVRITHVPFDAHQMIKVGTTVITVDAFQYDLTYDGKKYIKVDKSEIIGIETADGYEPIGNTILVEYLPDEKLADRVAENDRRRAHRDYIDKHFIHISEAYTKGIDPNYLDVPEPKTTMAKVIAIGDRICQKEWHDGLNLGDTVMIMRNHGCVLPNGQWILNMDLVLCKISDFFELIL